MSQLFSGKDIAKFETRSSIAITNLSGAFNPNRAKAFQNHIPML